MTGKLPPVWNAPAAGTGPELRASHADRDRAVDVLRVAAGEGRLTTGELDERVGAALSARTCRELAELTADLPDVPAAVTSSPEDLVRIDCGSGYTQRSGRWVVPQAMEVSVVGGAVRLDFTEAVITRSALRLRATVRGGLLTLRTKWGMEVDAGNISLTAGNVMIRPAGGRLQPVIFRIEISGENVGGWVVADTRRYPRPRGGRAQ
jgi:hypothetical protein